MPTLGYLGSCSRQQWVANPLGAPMAPVGVKTWYFGTRDAPSCKTRAREGGAGWGRGFGRETRFQKEEKVDIELLLAFSGTRRVFAFLR